MSFAKSFLVSLLGLMIFNVAFFFIAYAIGGNIPGVITAITNDIAYLMYILFSSTGHAIWVLINSLLYAVQDPFSLFGLVFALFFILSPLITAILTGRLSDNRLHSLLGFFLSVIICMLICIILAYYGFTYQILIGGSLSQSEAVINIVLGSLVNGVIYGLISFALTNK
jgi:hypothetical protein